MKSFFDKFQLSKKIDRTLTGNLANQVLLLTTAFCMLLAFGTILAFCLKAASGIDPSEPLINDKPYTLFWWVFLHAVNPGNIILETGGPVSVSVLAGIITLLGWILLGGLLITLLTNTYWRRMDRARQGKSRYSFSGHTIIFGWDEMVIDLIHNQLNPGKSGKEIVIISPHGAEELRFKINSNLPESNEKYIYVLNGEFVEEEIRSLHIDAAEAVYIFGDRGIIGCNNKNLEIALTIANILEPNRTDCLPCYVHLPAPSAFEMIQGVDFIQGSTKSVDIRLFSFHEDWARRLWSQKPGDITQEYALMQIGKIDPSIHRYAHFVIVGFGKMGQALTRYTARMAHFETRKKTQITIIDKNITNKKNQFYAQTPGIKNVADIHEIEFIEKDIFSEDLRDKLSEWAEEPNRKLQITICISNPDQALNMGMTLPKEIKERNIPVLIRQARFNKKAFWVQQSEDKNVVHSNNWKHLYFFGWRNEFYNWKDHEKLARAIHQTYRDVSKKDGWLDESKPQYKKWEELPECFRWSNRYRADMIAVKLRRIGREVTKLLSDEDLNDFTEEETELMARMEHNRWCAERFIDGWEHGDKRDNNAKLHPDLIDFDELSDQQKKYDLNTLNDIKQLFKKAGI